MKLKYIRVFLPTKPKIYYFLNFSHSLNLAPHMICFNLCGKITFTHE